MERGRILYDNTKALVQEMRAAGIEHRCDTPEDDTNVFDTVRVGWQGRRLPRTTILIRVNDRGAHLETLPLGDIPDRFSVIARQRAAMNAFFSDRQPS